MAYTGTTTAIPSGTGYLAALRDWTQGKRRRVGDAMARHREYSRVYSELTALNERQLADIGIARSAIDSIAREHAYGK